MSRFTEDELSERFDHHPPTREGVAERHAQVREICKDAARKLDALISDDRPRERAQVLTDLENAMMHANAGIARHYREAKD